MAKDLYHDAVTAALMKDGWTIIKENYKIEVDEAFSIIADILAEKYILAHKEKHWIIVEVKSFARPSKIYEFHSAIGQYITYLAVLEYLKLEIELYLAVPEDVFEELFQLPFVNFLISKYQIQLMPFSPLKKILTK